MSHPIPHFITPEEYLSREEKAEFKSEYRNGKIYPLASSTVDHNLVRVNAVVALAQALKGKPFHVFMNGLRLYVAKSKLYTYPDVMVVRDPIQFDPRNGDTVINPTLIVDIYDGRDRNNPRNDKFQECRGILSLQDYIMIDQTRPYAE